MLMLMLAGGVLGAALAPGLAPMARGGEGVTGHSVLTLESETTISLQLRSRKNKQSGATLRRACSCQNGGNRLMCPVHALWHGFFAELEPGQQPWAHMNPGQVIKHIRMLLQILKVTCSVNRLA